MKRYNGILLVIYGKSNEIKFYRSIGKYLLQNNIKYKLVIIDLFGSKNENDCEIFFEIYDDISNILFDKNFEKEFYYFYQDRFINELSYQTCYGQYNATYEEIIKAFVKVSNFAYYILKKYPDYLIYSRAPDNYFANTFIAVAEFLDRKYFWLEKSYWCDGYTFFSDKEYTNDIFKEKIELKNIIELAQLKKFFSKTAIKSNKHLFQYQTIIKKFKNNFEFLKFYKEYRNYKEKIIYIPWINYPLINDFKNKLCRNIKRFINKKIYAFNSLSFKDVKKLSKKYKILFFPLHYQPEAATLTMQPFFNNQYFLIKFISDILPPGWVLLVKEHPIQDFGLRKLNFYRDIASHKNVFLVDNVLTIDELNEYVDKIITIGGTLGFESIIKGKDVLVCSNVYYSNYKGVYKLFFDIYNFNKTKDSLYTFLTSKINSNSEKDLQKLLNNYYNSIIQLDLKNSIIYVFKNIERFWK